MAILSFLDQQIGDNQYIVVIFIAVGSIETFSCALIVYLMQRHNEKHYYKFLLLLNKLHFTFCCKRLAPDAKGQLNASNIEANIEANVEANIEGNNSSNTVVTNGDVNSK